MSALLIQTVFNAAYAASYMALIAVGLVLIFGVMGVINFAHGELYMMGAYAVVALYGALDVPFPLAVLAGLVFVGCLGLLMEVGLFRPLRENPLGGLIASIGFLLILQSLAVLGFGLRMQNVLPVTKERLVLGGAVLTYERLIVIAAAVIVLTLLWLFLRKTRLGWALRAVAQDREAAALQGISVDRTARYAMFIGAALAGIAGALTAPLVAPTPYMGHPVIVTAFIIIIVGGIGSLEGAVIAAILYALVDTVVTTLYDGVIANIIGLLLMLGVLIVLPNGLFGARERA
ncbi:MAG TPA: branched-chain amino acid ABC transporter permease [Propylenella sp.]